MSLQAANFQLKSKYKPAGDQPEAIRLLTQGVDKGAKHQTLLGVTGSGKTFTMANIIANTAKPALVLAHNKTLAAQLFSEFKEFFPENAVSYFVSYYDYYQPEAYVPRRDLYIEKESEINKDIERYRSLATQSALTRKDVIIVASVSCIYGIGSPEDYSALSRTLEENTIYPRSKLFIHLTDMQYYRSEYDFYAGNYRVRGDNVDVYLVGQEEALRIEYFGDEIQSLKIINPMTGEVLKRVGKYIIFPAKQYVTPFERIKTILPKIEEDLALEKEAFLKENRIVEATRLEQRVNYDLEMLREVGYTTGIENYSRYLDGRPIGSPPSTLLDYLGEDWLLFVDESHMTLPQIRGMYNGDRARKGTLVDYGFRLRAALDNRPLKYEEFQAKINQAIYVSATPTLYELELSQNSVKQIAGLEHMGIVEQIIRPTGLVDPYIYIRPSQKIFQEKLLNSISERKLDFQFQHLQNFTSSNQIDDLISEINQVIAKKQRVLVTTLTKRMAEELTDYLEKIKISVKYIHSDIDSIERVEILQELREGGIDVVVGINLLREGLDLPEVSLVAILDADKEGFLRSETSFIQTVGRAARHIEGRVIFYADRVTDSMYRAIIETDRRRTIQNTYNIEHNITPQAIVSKIKHHLERTEVETEKSNLPPSLQQKMAQFSALKPNQKKALRKELLVEMELAADALEYERAAEIRDFLNTHFAQSR